MLLWHLEVKILIFKIIGVTTKTHKRGLLCPRHRTLLYHFVGMKYPKTVGFLSPKLPIREEPFSYYLADRINPTQHVVIPQANERNLCNIGILSIR